jgi:hypothetical protein
MRPRKIVSGGQTGADRAALDAALELGVPIGGWLPKGRRDENGEALPPRYVDMQETASNDVRERTERNVIDSDATLIFSHGELTGGSAYTRTLARRHSKVCLHVDLAGCKPNAAAETVQRWLQEKRPSVLNVAGPRHSGDPAIYDEVRQVLRQVLRSGQDESR